jgi:hypothetical protein
MTAETLSVSERPESIKDVASLPVSVFLMCHTALGWIFTALEFSHHMVHDQSHATTTILRNIFQTGENRW